MGGYLSCIYGGKVSYSFMSLLNSTLQFNQYDEFYILIHFVLIDYCSILTKRLLTFFARI